MSLGALVRKESIPERDKFIIDAIQRVAVREKKEFKQPNKKGQKEENKRQMLRALDKVEMEDSFLTKNAEIPYKWKYGLRMLRLILDCR